MQPQRNRLIYVSGFIALAILIHLLFILPMLSIILKSLPDQANYDPMNVDLWQWEPQKPKTAEEELENYEPKEEIPKGRVVETPKSKNNKKPKKADYLSEVNNTVKTQTQGPSQRGNPMPSPTRQPKKQPGRDAVTVKGFIPPEQRHTVPKPEQNTDPKKQTDSPDGKIPIGNKVKEPSTTPILTPNMNALADAIHGSGLDHLEDVFSGDATALNTVAWDHASFFNRIKRQVKRHWHPNQAYRNRDPYGNIYGIKDRTSVLLVILHPDGLLKQLYVMKPSGVPFLDDEAYNAISKAAPFPNVPKGLVSKSDGLVKFTFHFVVEVGSRPILRMRQYN